MPIDGVAGVPAAAVALLSSFLNLIPHALHSDCNSIQHKMLYFMLVFGMHIVIYIYVEYFYLWASWTVPPKRCGGGVTVCTSTSKKRIIVGVVVIIGICTCCLCLRLSTVVLFRC